MQSSLVSGMTISGLDFDSIRKDPHKCNNTVNKLISKGYKRQTFVLSATMADIAEYHPELINPDSMIYAGTNAKRCINLIFNKAILTCQSTVKIFLLYMDSLNYFPYCFIRY